MSLQRDVDDPEGERPAPSETGRTISSILRPPFDTTWSGDSR